MNQGPTFVSVAVLAKRYAVSQGTIRRMIRLGKLRAIYVGRILRISLESVRKFEADHGFVEAWPEVLSPEE